MLLGQLIAASGKLLEAKRLFRANLQTARALHGDGAPMTTMAATHLCAVLMERGELSEAEAERRRCSAGCSRSPSGCTARRAMRRERSRADSPSAACAPARRWTEPEMRGACGNVCSTCEKQNSCAD